MKRVLSFLLVLSLILAFPLSVSAALSGVGQLVSASVQTVSGSTYVSGISYRDQAEGVFDIGNIRRKEAGLRELEWNEDLIDFALLRGLESIVSFSHTRPDGQEWHTVGKGVNGENLAYGDTHYEDVMAGWMNSPSHRQNILDKDYKSIAVACIESDTGRIYWVQLFSQYTETNMPATASNSTSKPATAEISPATGTAGEIVTLAQNAIASATGVSVTVRARNIGAITAADMAAIAKAGQTAGKTVMIHADTLSGDSVTGRMYVEPAKFGSSIANLRPGVHIDSEKAAVTEDFFRRWFQNKIFIISLDHQGSFGRTVHIAVKADLSNLNADSLIFYTYDRDSNKYARVAEPNYSTDINGYLHFYTSMGGYIVITDTPLQSR